jgi:hypothetical protein
MAGLDPAIHVFGKSWMPGTRPGMTEFYSAAWSFTPNTRCANCG